MIMMTIVNNPGDWAFIYPPLEHAEWHGCTPTDLVFPFFIFAMGASIPLANASGQILDAKFLQKIFIRTLRIFCLGLCLNFFSKIHVGNLDGIFMLIIRLAAMYYAGKIIFNVKLNSNNEKLVIGLFVFMLFLAFSGFEYFKFVRLPGVLQRLAIVYFWITLIHVVLEFKNQLKLAIGILVVYYLLMAFVPIANHGFNNFEKGTNLAAWVDHKLLTNHLWVVAKTWDPEGILSTFPAIVSGLIGLWAGIYIKTNQAELEKRFALAGLAMLVFALLWSFIFPINKALWTSSYVLYSAGWALLFYAGLHYIYENKKIKIFSDFFQMWGLNPLIVFFVSGILPRALSMLNMKLDSESAEKPIMELIYHKWYLWFFDNYYWASLLWALMYVALWSIALKKLKQRNLILKV